MWIKILPRANHILDLGGSAAGDKRGALVAMGYPYPFEELKIVDLPLEKRHKIYAEGYNKFEPFLSDKGKITYIYSSMTDLDDLKSYSVDLINMGQSIEHIPEHEVNHVLLECMRILNDNGFLCIDTPNRVATRLQSETYIDPDHKKEYSHSELSQKIGENGFFIVEQKDLNYIPSSFKTGQFEITEASKNYDIYDDIEHCYLLGYRCKKTNNKITT
jgi:SAM-dependent methyltransferase